MKDVFRRNFLKYLWAVPFAAPFFSCKNRHKITQASTNQQLKKDASAMNLSKAMTKDQVFSMLDRRVEVMMKKSNHCAQSTYYTLSEQFGLGGDDVLKALTPLPGMAERGETCGAITGALMAMGMLYGRDNLDDWEKYRRSLIPTNKFCQQFEKEMGATSCWQIQERAFGVSFNLMDPDQLKNFQRAGATSKCSKVVQKACRLAASIILEDRENT